MGKERQKADIHFLRNLLGATEVVSQVAKRGILVVCKVQVCQDDTYGQKNRLYKNKPIEVPT